jgi:hypothetical protein
MRSARPQAYSTCIKCGKPFPTKDFFRDDGVCIICEHLDKQIEVEEADKK